MIGYVKSLETTSPSRVTISRKWTHPRVGVVTNQQ